MMRFLFLVLFFSMATYAQHTSINITEKGLNSITNRILESYQYSKKTSTLTYKSKTIYESIPAKFFQENRVLKEINKFLPLNQNEDFVFYVNASPIKIDGKVAENSLEISTEGTEDNFNINLKISIESLKLSGEKLELCELKNWKCNKSNSLYSKVSDLVIKASRDLDVGIILNAKVNGGKTTLSFKKLYTNLVAPKSSSERKIYKKLKISQDPIKLDIHFSDFYLPPLKIYINGEELVRNFSKLKDSVLVHKEYLGKQLALHAGNFVAKDLVNMINKDLLGSLGTIKSKYSVLDYSSELSDLDKQLGSILRGGDRELEFESNLSMKEKIKRLFKILISQAKYDISFKGAKTGIEKNLQLDFTNTFELNGKVTKLSTSLRNGRSKLRLPNFEKIKDKNYDIAVAVSEPLINGALNALNDTKVIQSIVRAEPSLKGVYVNKIHFHLEGEGNSILKVNRSKFDKINMKRRIIRKDNLAVHNKRHSLLNSRFKLEDSEEFSTNDETTTKTDSFEHIRIKSSGEVVLVAEVMVRLSELPTNSTWEAIENRIGSWKEGGEIWFPLEIRFTAKIKKSGYKTVLALTASNPIAGDRLVNTYNYPYKKMWGKVEQGIIKALIGKEDGKGLIPMLDNLPEIDLTPYLEVEGMTLKPKNVYVHKTGHLIITSDIECLEIEKLGRKK